MKQRRVVVLGIGNLLNSDEGVGVHAIRAMQRSPHGAQVELLDGGTLGLTLLVIVEETTHLLLLDAIDAGQPPGTVIELTKVELPLFRGINMSQHQVTFQDVLGLALVRDRLPGALHVIGIQPDSLAIGDQLSQIVAAALPDMVARAWAKVDEWEQTR
jgi:hydrogenase maturation protease